MDTTYNHSILFYLQVRGSRGNSVVGEKQTSIDYVYHGPGLLPLAVLDIPTEEQVKHFTFPVVFQI